MPEVPARADGAVAKQGKKHVHQYLLPGAPSLATRGKDRFTTRHLAALDFLLNIPMANESLIRETGMTNAKRAEGIDGEQSDEQALQQQLILQQMQESEHMGQTSPIDAAGAKKLPGPFAPTVRVPMLFRFILARISDQGALVRRWEEQLLSRGPMPLATAQQRLASSPDSAAAAAAQKPSGILRSRIFFSRARSYPAAVFSVIGYDIDKEKARVQKLLREDQKGLEVFELPQRDWRGCSYKPLFKAMRELVSEGLVSDYFFERGFLHDPNAIDNPKLLHAEYRYMLQRSANTGPLISSVILYVNELELKESLNESFRERHPNLPPSLTLSKIRNLKKSCLLGCLSLSLEVSTCALAVIYFERLVMQALVTKVNRHLSMAVSLLLAYKFNEPVTDKYTSRLVLVLQFIDREWEVSKKEVFDAEFGAFVCLGFSLHVPYQHIHLMVTRLMSLVNRGIKPYLGEDMMDRFSADVYMLERMRTEAKEEREEREREAEEARRQEEAEEEEERQQKEREEDEREREREAAAEAAATAETEHTPPPPPLLAKSRSSIRNMLPVPVRFPFQSAPRASVTEESPSGGGEV